MSLNKNASSINDYIKLDLDACAECSVYCVRTRNKQQTAKFNYFTPSSKNFKIIQMTNSLFG